MNLGEQILRSKGSLFEELQHFAKSFVIGAKHLVSVFNSIINIVIIIAYCFISILSVRLLALHVWLLIFRRPH